MQALKVCCAAFGWHLTSWALLFLDSLAFGLKLFITPEHAPKDQDTLLDEFFAWGREQNVVGLDNIRLGRISKDGQSYRGLFATRAIAKDTTVLTVPLQLVILSLHWELKYKLFCNLLGDVGRIGINATSCLSLFLAIDRRRLLNGRLSSWGPYVQMLPSARDYAHFHPNYIGAELLSNFSFLRLAHGIRWRNFDLERRWRRHGLKWKDLSRAHEVDGLSFDDVRWAFTVYSSRSWREFTLCGVYNETCVLIPEFILPFVDLANHALEGSQTMALYPFARDPPSCKTVASRDIAEGEELTFSYGNINSEEDFWTYGFKAQGVPMKMALVGGATCETPQVQAMLGSTPGGPQAEIMRSLQGLTKQVCSRDWHGMIPEDSL